MNEQARLDRERTKSEATLKKEVEKTRQSLLVELGKLQSDLKGIALVFHSYPFKKELIEYYRYLFIDV